MDTVTYDIATMFLVFWLSFVLMLFIFYVPYAIYHGIKYIVDAVKDIIDEVNNDVED